MCGSPLFASENSSIIVKGIKFFQAQNYSAKLIPFPPICYDCGLAEALADNEEIQKLKKCSTIVLPICLYLHDGRSLIVRSHRTLQKSKNHLRTVEHKLRNIAHNF